MDSTASGSQVSVLLHQVDEQSHGVRLEVDVSVKSQQIRVLGDNLLPFHGDRQLHQTMSEQVVHVHHLRK